MPTEEHIIEIFEYLSRKIYNNNVEHGWWDNEDADALVEIAREIPEGGEEIVYEIARKMRARNDGELIALMHSELSEALEFLRKGNKPSDHIPEFLGVEEEFADVIIRIMDMAHRRGYRLAPAILAKMQFNESRPYKHGGKRF